MRAIPAVAMLLLSLVLAGPAAAQFTDSPPSTPANLAATVYSGTAGAISWDRSTDDRGAVTGYEISRDGTAIGVRDALSYVDPTLAPGTAYTYRVTAIDNAGQRSGTASVRLTTPGSGSPAAPAGLRRSVYSATAAEIFWNRSTTFGLTYEVRRDGAVLATTDGTSHFDDALAGGRSYTYEVIAIDAQGRRSTSSRVTLDTQPGPSGSNPALPAGLRAQVYSTTAGEIFWERSAVFGLTYDVRRNGTVLTTTDGTSYFDDTLAAGRRYTYSIVAIDRQGRRSAAAEITLTKPGPLITFDSQERLLEEVFEIYSGEAWDTTPLSLITRAISGGGRSVFESIDNLVPFTSAPVLRANCRTGSGRLETTLPNSGASVPWTARLDACTPDPERAGLALISGSVEGTWNRRVSARSDELVWTTASGERVRFDGEISRGPFGFEPDATTAFIASNATQIVRDDADGTPLRSIEEATSTRRAGSIDTRDIATLSGGFTYRSDGTDGLAVTVSTPIDLAYHWNLPTPAPDGVPPESLGELPLGDETQGQWRTEEQNAAVDRLRQRWAFTVGMLELQAEDGSHLVLDADTGDLDTVRITLDEGGGAGAEVRVIEWPGSWYRALAPGLASSRYETPD